MKTRRVLVIGISISFFTLIAVILCFCKTEERMLSVFSIFPGNTVFIDAGHGGEDGGAIAFDGTLEKNINLQISKKTEFLFNFVGVNTDMTRREDCSLCNDPTLSLRQRKNTDLKNRVNKIANASDVILVSVHQNSFKEDASCHGSQVFFSRNNVESEHLAKSIQSTLNENVDTTNKRVEKESPSSVFLMKKVNCPAVLVECGFLSNIKECGLLVDDSYQLKISAGIVSGYLKYKK